MNTAAFEKAALWEKMLSRVFGVSHFTAVVPQQFWIQIVLLSPLENISIEVRWSLSPFVCVCGCEFVHTFTATLQAAGSFWRWYCQAWSCPFPHWVYYCRTPLCLTVQTLLMALMCPRGPIVLLNQLERYLLLQSAMFSPVLHMVLQSILWARTHPLDVRPLLMKHIIILERGQFGKSTDWINSVCSCISGPEIQIEFIFICELCTMCM